MVTRSSQADRLLRLGMTRAALHWARTGSAEEYRRATRSQLAHLGDHAPLLRRHIRQARPDIVAARFDPPDWHVAMLLTDPADPLLVIDGRKPIVYRADDPEGERRGWLRL